LILTLCLLCITSASGEIVTKVYLPTGEKSDLAGSQLAVYSPAQQRILKYVDVSPGADRAFTSTGSDEVWVFSSSGTACDIVSTVRDEVVESFDVGVNAISAVFGTGEDYCYVIGPNRLSGDDNGIVAVDLSTYRSGPQALLPFAIGATAVAHSAGYLFCSAPEKGLIVRLILPDLEFDTSIYVGPEPIDLRLTGDEKWLIVACRGLESGRRGGAQIVVLDPISGRLEWIFNRLPGSPTSLALDETEQLVATFSPATVTEALNIASFEIDFDTDDVDLTRIADWLLGEFPGRGLITDDGSYWLGIDQTNGRPLGIELNTGEYLRLSPELIVNPDGKLATVSFDVDEKIAALEATLDPVNDTLRSVDIYSDIAYLQHSAGRENDVVTTCQAIVADHPNSFAAIEARFRLADVASANQLHSRAAEYRYDALHSYKVLLESQDSVPVLPDAPMLDAVRGIALYSEQFDEDLLEKLAKLYLNLKTRRGELTLLLYQTGLELVRLDDGLAEDCFERAEYHLEAIDNSQRARLMQTRLGLALEGKATIYEIEKRGGSIEIDGDISDWNKVSPIALSSAERLSYGRANWLDVQDLSGELYLTRSNTSLLLAGRIWDDSLVQVDANNVDYMGIYLDLRPTAASVFTREEDLGDGCFSIRIKAPAGALPKASVELSRSTPYQIASQKIEQGYTFELSLPVTMFGTWWPDEEREFGLGVELVDFDTPADPEQRTAMGFLLPRPQNDGDLQPQLFGRGRFD
jgi:hypothetical protein